jgi:6-phosphogluconolactonase
VARRRDLETARAKPVIHKFEDPSDLASALAKAVKSRLARAVSEKGRALLLVSGGSTPGRFFDALSQETLPWEKICVSLVDERCVAADHERSNARFVRERLLVGNAAEARFVPLFDPASETPDAAAEQAENSFAKLGAPDVCILGMGMDGHTASFFPGGDNLETALDPAAKRTVVSMKAPGAGEPRLTVTLPVILSAAMLVLHVEGEEKMAVIGEALNPGPADSLPVRAVLDHAGPNLEIFWTIIPRLAETLRED